MFRVDDIAGLRLINLFGSIEIPEGATQLTIETRRNKFYQLVGKCIKEWANVEEKLFELCVFALTATYARALGNGEVDGSMRSGSAIASRKNRF
jgi:hypothetical protein